MGKWSKEFRLQLFGNPHRRENRTQRWIRNSGNRSRRKAQRDLRKARKFAKCLGF